MPRSFTITATGDLMFYDDLAASMREEADALWGVRPVCTALRQGDVLFGNLETPVSVRRRAEPGCPNAYFSPSGIGLPLAELGYDVLNLAHNHIYDFGSEGVEATMNELREAHVGFIGVGITSRQAAHPLIVRKPNDVAVGFLGYATANNAVDPKHRYVACFPDLDVVTEHVKRLREEVTAVVVSCHTGAQYNPYPAPETRRLARVAIEAGAAVFLGHHAHVPQGIERIGNGLAVYGLGDFCAPVRNAQCRRRFFIRMHILGDRVLDYEVIPCTTTERCQTVVAEDLIGDEILAHMDELSQALKSDSSDRLHFETARSRFLSQYVTSWVEEFRQGGAAVIVRKIRSLRPYHWQLMRHSVLSSLSIFRRSRSVQPLQTASNRRTTQPSDGEPENPGGYE